ncbi:MAG: heme A synthase [Leptothrix sp. (in: b-proteobacteria)]
MSATPLIDLGPAAQMAAAGALLATLALAWLGWRHRGASTATRLRALTLLCLFLTFDLILFGAYTRLTDSGLGCPDWPGCYGQASPLGAQHEISQAQATMPSGPVTHAKAWVEMVHRYLATGVGALLTVLMLWSTWAARQRQPGDRGIAPGWAALTFLWVCLQGAFGALTVTMKLYPAIVTGHLLGGVGLLALLAVQAERHAPQPFALPAALRGALWALFVLVLGQITLGGWVSTNYAVLACADFPTCQGQWWPPTDFDAAYTLRRELGQGADGSLLPFAALTAIHLTHRIGALVVLLATSLCAWALWRSGTAGARATARGLLLLLLWQLLSGISNVVLGWPLLAAVAHTGGAAALLAWIARALARARAPVHLTLVTSAQPDRPRQTAFGLAPRS